MGAQEKTVHYWDHGYKIISIHDLSVCVTWNEYSGPAWVHLISIHDSEGDQIAYFLITLGDKICITETSLKLNIGQTLSTGLNIVPTV